MLCAAMARLRTPKHHLALGAVLAAGLTGCGSQDIQLASDDSNYRGAQIFHANCSGCHTLDQAGAQGSYADISDREYKDGPNFNQRAETYEQVLYAIRNGGFSSGPMPQNIVVGKEAEQVARFVEKYSGENTPGREPQPGRAPASGTE
jgi:mono/diheme cytochrome c family protein